jgi:hypothetical protein
MTTAVWPVSLPCRPLRGFDETPRVAKATFESDTGPPIERPKGTIRMADANVVFRMTTAQMAVLEDFVRTTLQQATLPFTFRHPRRDVDVKVRLPGDNPYQCSEAGPGLWSVSMKFLLIG